MNVSQCWFCHQVNAVDPEDPRPCLRCGLSDARVRPDTSALLLLPRTEAEPSTGHAGSRPTAGMLPTPVAPAPTAMSLSLDLEATRIVTPSRWALTTEHNDVVWLDTDDVVIGRRPVASGDAIPLVVPDPSQTLSKTHARLRRDINTDTWWIEDVGSTNGVTLFDDTLSTQTTLTPGKPVVATSFIVLGDMRTRLQRHLLHDVGAAA